MTSVDVSSGSASTDGFVGERRANQVHRPLRDEEAGHRGDERQHRGLGQELSDETPASGPKGQTRGQLLRARGRASQQEVGHVDTGDEQHERGDGQEQGQWCPSVRRETALSARPGVETDAPRPELRHHRIAHALLERHLDLVDDGAIGRVNRGARLFQRDAWLQTGEQVDPISASILWWAARVRAPGASAS